MREIKANKNQLFYKGNKIHIVQATQQTITVFRTPSLTLAERQSGTRAVEGLLLASDAQGSILGSNSENIFRTQSYTAYGHHLRLTPSLLAYNGELPTPTGTYLLGKGYRTYNPILMRFHSADSLSPFEGGGINAYSYCEGDSINNIDPDGHHMIPWGIRKIFRSSAGQARHYQKIYERNVATRNEIPSTILYGKKYNSENDYQSQPINADRDNAYNLFGNSYKNAEQETLSALVKAINASKNAGIEYTPELPNSFLFKRYNHYASARGPVRLPEPTQQLTARQAKSEGRHFITQAQVLNTRSGARTRNGLTAFDTTRPSRRQS